MHEGLRVAVVVPAAHAGWRLDRVVASLPPLVDGVVVVDDGPGAVADLPGDAVVVRHARNRGVGAATLTGWQAAREFGADVAVVMAADGQMDPADLPALLEPIATGDADLVKGDRLSHPACERVMPAVRRAGNCCLTFATRVVSGRWDVMDSQCGYTALRLDTLDRLPLDWLYTRYGFPNDLVVAAVGARLRLAQVVVAPVYAGEPSGIRPLAAALVYPWILARGVVVRVVAGRRRRVLPGAA
jgi:glycosyltransferase involved in cell wall biosynthesis